MIYESVKVISRTEVNHLKTGQCLAMQFLGGGGIALGFINQSEVVEHARHTAFGACFSEKRLRLLVETDCLGYIGRGQSIRRGAQRHGFQVPIPRRSASGKPPGKDARRAILHLHAAQLSRHPFHGSGRHQPRRNHFKD